MVDKDAVKYTYDFADATNQMADAMHNMSESLMINLNTSKAWTIVSRMTSGSDFWKLQSKLRAITDGFVLYDRVQNKAIKNSKKYGEQIKKIAELRNKVPLGLDTNLMGQIENAKLKKGKPPNIGKLGGKTHKQLDSIMNSDTYKAWKTVFGGEEAAKYAKEQIDAQVVGIAQLNKRLEWQVGLEKGDIRTRLSIRKEQFLMMMKGLGTSLMNFIRVTIPAFFITFGKWFLILAVAIPAIAIIIRSIFELGKLTFEFLKLGLEDMAIDLDDYIEYFRKVFDWVVEILSSMLNIIDLAINGSLLEAIGALLKLMVVTILIKGLLLLGEGIAFALMAGIALVIGALKWVAKTLSDKLTEVFGIKVGMGSVGRKGGYASGGTSMGGMAMVGESGPEMVYLPNGARVVNSPNSRRGGANVNVYVSGRVGASDAEINDIAQKVGRAISIQMNRSSNTGVSF